MSDRQPAEVVDLVPFIRLRELAREYGQQVRKSPPEASVERAMRTFREWAASQPTVK